MFLTQFFRMLIGESRRYHLEIETSWGLILGADIAEIKSEARDRKEKGEP